MTYTYMQHPTSGETYVMTRAPDRRRIILGPCRVADGHVYDPDGVLLTPARVDGWAANLTTSEVDACARDYSWMMRQRAR